MTFEVEIDGKRRAVSIEPSAGGAFRVVVDGDAHIVRAERTGEFGLSIIQDEAVGRSVEVTVTPAGSKGEVLVGLAGKTVAVSIDGRRRRAAIEGAHADGEQAVTAPMPGRVARVLVAPGDEVTARQGVVVVEAMKMENELRSPKAGRVKDVSVAPGTLVEAGRVLVVIE
ncbi:MAG TPA: biotin/lipoyl-containing protein [Vicinamibacterales bacterium]|nr:biotin/lipoyl-containing protein [Vicinamibacterales bacterium]